jgi:hypothetical protein
MLFHRSERQMDPARTYSGMVSRSTGRSVPSQTGFVVNESANLRLEDGMDGLLLTREDRLQRAHVPA